MMVINLINAEDALGKPGGHYSHVVAAGNTLYLSGQLPIDAQGRKLHDEPFEVQLQQVFDNLDAVLQAAGSHRAELVQVRVYLVDIDQWPVFNQRYATWLGSHRPARSVVPVPALHYGLALEIEAIAYRSTQE